MLSVRRQVRATLADITLRVNPITANAVKGQRRSLCLFMVLCTEISWAIDIGREPHRFDQLNIFSAKYNKSIDIYQFKYIVCLPGKGSCGRLHEAIVHIPDLD